MEFVRRMCKWSLYVECVHGVCDKSVRKTDWNRLVLFVSHVSFQLRRIQRLDQTPDFLNVTLSLGIGRLLPLLLLLLGSEGSAPQAGIV